MATTTRIERRKRGVIGTIFLLLFWAFNALMVFALFVGLSDSGAEMQKLTSEAERSGYAAGTAIGTMMIVMVWAAGALILGLFVLLTRGNKVVIETREAD